MPEREPPEPDDEPPLCILLSPHGERSGIYKRVRGSLAGFGIRGVHVERRTDRKLARELAEAWGEPMLDEAIDHGVLVPLLLGLPPNATVVAATLREITGPHAAPVSGAIEQGHAFAAALERVAGGREVIFAASAHTAAALSPDAPLMERPEAHELEDLVTTALEEDLGRLGGIDTVLWERSGSCGAGPLSALASLFPGQTVRTSFRESPFGVGYLLAQTA